MPLTFRPPLVIFGLLLLSAAIVSCDGPKKNINSAGTGSLVHVNESPLTSSEVTTPTSAQPERAPFRPDAPTLCGLSLGAAESDVVGLYGVPNGTYSLPGDGNSVQIWEYTGFSVGMNDAGKVVYVEMNSEDIESRIQGLFNGMAGKEAADLLGAELHAGSNVISLKVAGGFLKLDLDPDSQAVLSMKLISSDI